ncbi:serine/threonine-protein phosphatase, partial [Trifolium pratense]
MREAEEKLINARQEMTQKSKMPTTSKWMRNTIALAPTVLASLYKDLSVLKKQIVDLEKHPLEGIKFPLELEVNVESPFYLVQVWASERFKNLKLKAKLIENEDHMLFRWHRVKPLKVDNVKLALDSANKDNFLWRPYVKYADKYGKFYPKDEVLVPVKKDLGKEILSFVICLRVSELIGFESIEQYQPHRVAMQFGLDQDIPGSVPRFNETKTNAWNNYCRPISDTNVYFPSRCSEGNVTMRYEKWWKRSASSSKCTTPNDIPLEFPPPKLVGTVTFG